MIRIEQPFYCPSTGYNEMGDFRQRFNFYPRLTYCANIIVISAGLPDKTDSLSSPSAAVNALSDKEGNDKRIDNRHDRAFMRVTRFSL